MPCEGCTNKDICVIVWASKEVEETLQKFPKDNTYVKSITDKVTEMMLNCKHYNPEN